MRSPSSRRSFMKQLAAAGVALPFAGELAVGAPKGGAKAGAKSAAKIATPSRRINIASVGVGGKGIGDTANAVQAGHNLVAICDVDSDFLAAAAKQYPDAKRFSDWRKMLEQMKEIDAVSISTPDHMHAPITLAAIALGKHVHCQKPLTHSIAEARRVTEAAKKAGVKTLMGNQHHSSIGYRQIVELVRSGVIGKITEAHAWTNRPGWPQGMDAPTTSDPVPATLDWDLWLGIAEERPYVADVYHPKRWRGWYDFGTGALGDMGCHIMDPIVWSCDLGGPIAATAHCEPGSAASPPAMSTTVLEFAATNYAAKGFTLTWYDGKRKELPQALRDKLPGVTLHPQGTLIIGEKGAMLTDHGGSPVLYPQKNFAGVELPRLERSAHYESWTNAIIDGGESNSPFSVAGPLTETVLMGALVVRFPGQRLEWDAANLRFTNSAEATKYVSRTYRKGWEM